MSRIRPLLLLLSVLAPAAVLAWPPAPFHPRPTVESGWPGWRGPFRDGVSRETGLLRQWPTAGPKLRWKTATLGAGFSAPAVVRGRVYLLGMRNDKEHLFCLDAAREGKELWSAELGASKGTNLYPGPRSTPAVWGDRVYALSSGGAMVCLNTAGKEVWRKNLVGDLGGHAPSLGYAESPLVDGEMLICTPGGPQAALAALDRKTGAVIWKARVEKGNQAAYASVVAAQVGRVRLYVQFLAGCLVGVSARDGKLLFSYDGVIGQQNCCTPVVHDDRVFVSAVGREKGGGALLALQRTGEGVTAREVYRVSDLANHYGGVVYLGGCLYGTNDSGLVCIDLASGKTKWRASSVGQGAISVADSCLYVRGDRGPLALAAATPAGYTEKSRFNPPHRGKTNVRPPPVVAEGRLYLRDQETLACYDVKQP